MGLYADKLLEMTKNIGKPTITKSTTTVDEGKEMDMSPLMDILMMFLMQSMFKAPAGSNRNPTATNFSTPLNSNPANLPWQSMQSTYGQPQSNNLGGWEQLMASAMFPKRSEPLK